MKRAEDIMRPLDMLNQLKGSRVLIVLRDGKEMAGVLLAFDIHINLAIEADGAKPVFIKGDNVVSIS